MPYPVVLGRNNSATTTNSTTHTVSFPSTPTDGDLLLVFVVFDGNTTPSWPAGWTQEFLVRTGQNEAMAELRSRVASGDGASISLTTGSEEMEARAWIIEKGTFSSQSEIEAATATGSSASPDSPSLSPTWGSDKNGWLVLIGTDASRAVSNPPTGYAQTGTANSGGTGGVGMGYAERQLEAASENPSSATITSGPWVAATVAVRGRTAASALAAVDAWVEARLDALEGLQATHAANHGGRYFQGIRWSAPADGADVPSDGSLNPHDQAENWVDFGISLPSRVPCSLSVDVYHTGDTWGYTVCAIITLGGVRWVKVWSGSSDPENRAVDWYADIEPEG